MKTLLRLRQVCDLTGLSKTAVYWLIKLDQFPRQLRLTQRRSVCWHSLDIEQWVRSRSLAHPVADPPSSEGTSNDHCSDKGRAMKTPEIRHQSRTNVTDLFPQNPILSDDSDSRQRQLSHDVRHLRCKDLIERYPAERNCFRGMKGRASTGAAVVDPGLARFKNFLSVLGPCPAPGWTVDRIDPFDPEYAPSKVRWASKVTQANNRTNTIMLTGSDGRVRPIAEWARVTRQRPDTLRKRYERGWTDIEIIAGERSLIHGHDDANVNVPTRRTGRWPALVAGIRLKGG